MPSSDNHYDAHISFINLTVTIFRGRVQVSTGSRERGAEEEAEGGQREEGHRG